MFFEGWYYKIVLANDSRSIAVIPGVLMNNDVRHAFVMVAYDNTSHYFHFPFEAFQAATVTEEFHVTIQRETRGQTRSSTFSAQELIVDIEPIEGDDATESVKMNITIPFNTRPTDLSWLLPGTMGPLSWLSILQCYHHVLSVRHDIHGTIQIGHYHQTNVSGIGYIEKDWGQMFPSSWIWGQANQWTRDTALPASLFFSFAIVPSGFGLELPGFLVIFEHNQQYYRFHSYLLSVVHNLEVDNRTNCMSFTVYDLFLEHKLRVSAHFNDANSAAMLYGPRHGRMEKFIKEMLDPGAYFDVRLSRVIRADPTEKSDDLLASQDYREHVLFEERAHHVALEMNGNVTWLSENFENIYGNYAWSFSVIRSIVQSYKLILLLITSIGTIFVITKFVGLSSPR